MTKALLLHKENHLSSLLWKNFLLNLTDLYDLYCPRNPLITLKVISGHTLSIPKSSGGKGKISDVGITVTGARVSLTAAPNAGYRFQKWMGLPAGVPNTAKTEFILDSNYTVEAVFAYTGGSGGESRGSQPLLNVPQAFSPALARVRLPALVTEAGAAAGTADDALTAAALAQIGKTARAKQGGIALQYDVITSQPCRDFSVALERATLDRLIAAQVKFLRLNTGAMDLTFDLAALKEIQRQSVGGVTFTAAEESGLPGEALSAVGSHPVYRLSVAYTGVDNKRKTIESLGTGSVTLGLANRSAAGKQTGSLRLFYSGDGKSAWRVLN